MILPMVVVTSLLAASITSNRPGKTVRRLAKLLQIVTIGRGLNQIITEMAKLTASLSSRQEAFPCRGPFLDHVIVK